MKQHHAQAGDAVPLDTGAASASGPGAPMPDEGHNSSRVPAANRDALGTDEGALVDRCRQGDEEAWIEVHNRCEAYVARQIRHTLGERGRDANLVEEIAARVWFTLVADDGHLLKRFKPQQSNGLERYLAAIARFEVLRHQRSEFRRRRREQETQIMRSSNSDERLLREMVIDVNDFLPNLTPREKEFFHHVLMGNNGWHFHVSAPNAWQLKHRIRKKLLKFLDMDDKKEA